MYFKKISTNDKQGYLLLTAEVLCDSINVNLFSTSFI